MRKFNLLDEKWILVLDRKCDVQKLSLLDVFRQPKEISCLANELPTVDIAILRLLLAIIHASLAREIKNEEEAIELWRSLWEHGLPFEKIEAYLEQWRNRFYLFDDKYPFFQVTFVEPPKDITYTYKSANNLNGEISEPDEKSPNLFAGQRDRSKLSYPEAARWLVHLNSFDIAPAGTPGKAPIRLKGYGLGYLSQIGVIWLKGDNLHQTLMLNFVLLDKNRRPWKENKPYWETCKVLDESYLKELQARDFEIPWPTNLAELYTTQWRKVRLVDNGTAVEGYELWAGCKMKNNNGSPEPMTMWRQSDANEYKPILHQPSRQLWRDFSALAVKDTEDTRPRIITWLDILKENEIELPLLRFCTAAISYTKNTKINDTFSDSLSFNADLLTKVGEKWTIRISEAISATDQAVNAVGTLAAELVESLGDKRDKQRKPGPAMAGMQDAAKAEGYFRLDEPFRAWLESIDPKMDQISVKLNEWYEKSYRILSKLGDELVDQMGTRAFIGTSNNGNYINSSIAYNKFISKISRILRKGVETGNEG